MLCAISDSTPREPVTSLKSGHIFEKALIEKHIRETSRCPVTGEELTVEDLLPLKIKTPMAPRPANLSSMPALLQTVQNEWDAVMLETYQLKAQLTETRKNLAKALYENDAAFRVIARLVKERDEAKSLLAQLRATPGAVRAAAPAEAMDTSDEEGKGITPAISAAIEAAHKQLSKGRKKRIKAKAARVAKKEELKRYRVQSSNSLHSASKPGILCMDLHPTNPILSVSGGNDSNVIVFDRKSGKIVDTLRSHKKKITDVVFHPDGHVLSASADGKAILWGRDAKGGYASRHVVTCHTASIVGVSLHPCNDYFITASSDKSWAFHDITTGVMRKRVQDSDHAYTSIACHPDGLLLGMCTADSNISMVDVRSDARRARLKGHSGQLTSLAFSQNGYYLASGDDQGVVNLWDLRKVRNFHTIQSSELTTVCDLTFDPSGSYLGVAGNDIRLFATKTWDLVQTYEDHRDIVTSLSFSENLSTFASCSKDRTVKFWAPA